MSLASRISDLASAVAAQIKTERTTNATLYAPLASAVLTGSPSAPTPPLGSSSTGIATTAYVMRAARLIPGIVADGATDNTSTITSWLSANLPNGGTARLPEGSIAVSGLAIPSGVTLVGAGAINTSPQNNPIYSTRLVPATSGQQYVVGLVNNSAAIRDIDIDALKVAATNVAQYALYVTANTCSAIHVGIYGGSAACLFGSGAATQFIAEHLYIRSGDNQCCPINTSGLDWQVTNSIINGPGSCFLNGANSCWANDHWVSNMGVNSGFPALIRDQGGQYFVNNYFDGTAGTAMIDRSLAYAPSAYYSSVFLQSVYGLTGKPIFKEPSGAGNGVTIDGLFSGGIQSSSSFTNLIDKPVQSTKVQNVSLTSSWLTGQMLGQAAPAGSNSNYRGNIVGGVTQSDSGLIALTQYGPTGGTSYNTSSTAWSAVDSTNLIATFIAPPSGRVLVRLGSLLTATSGAQMNWAVGLDGSTTPAGSGGMQVSNSSSVIGMNTGVLITGLVPGTSHTAAWLFADTSTSGTATMYVKAGTTGSQAGPATIEVWAA